MNDDQIKLLIERLEPFAAQNPGKYRLRLTALAALGYAYLLSVVVGLLTLAFVILAYVRFNAITIKIAWIPLVIAWLVLRSCCRARLSLGQREQPEEQRSIDA